ncbi:MAG: class I SAM-dependent methyltransferase [Candidatus Brocadiales bacterium]|nr:class I SAM-dependent methyltransferase [Candidatus Brocadiales bacterium]
MQPICCPVCKSESDNKEVERYQRYTLYWCSSCDLQWWHPLENPGASFYEETYVLRSIPSFADGPGWDQQQFFRYLPKKSGKLLDIGCGTGNFLGEVKRHGLAFQVSGLDFDRNAVETAKRSFGLENVYAMSLEEFCAKGSKGGFDVVTFFQVLEHQWDPVGFLERVKEFLVPGGYIVLGIPNRNTWKALLSWDHPPMHFTRWSPRALRSLLEEHGFSVVSILESPPTFPEARALIPDKIKFFRRLEDATAIGFKKMVVETKHLDGHLTLSESIRTVLGILFSVLRLLRKGILFVPALFLCTMWRLSSKRGYYLFCIAKKR